MRLGEKCAAHQMYSLAAELYAISISRDNEAFRKSMLWQQFAKACRLCGRERDGDLALKVSLSLLSVCYWQLIDSLSISL